MNTKNLKQLQCPCCIKLIYGRKALTRHLFAVHKKSVNEVIELFEKYIPTKEA
jgi:hypothetical protein